jgi:hypothetical protein
MFKCHLAITSGTLEKIRRQRYNCTPFQKTKVGMSFIHRRSTDVAAPLSHPIWAQIPKCNL